MLRRWTMSSSARPRMLGGLGSGPHCGSQCSPIRVGPRAGMGAGGAGGPRPGAEARAVLRLSPVVAEPVPAELIQDRLRCRETALRAVLEGLPDATVAAARDGRI